MSGPEYSVENKTQVRAYALNLQPPALWPLLEEKLQKMPFLESCSEFKQWQGQQERDQNESRSREHLGQRGTALTTRTRTTTTAFDFVLIAQLRTDAAPKLLSPLVRSGLVSLTSDNSRNPSNRTWNKKQP